MEFTQGLEEFEKRHDCKTQTHQIFGKQNLEEFEKKHLWITI